MATVSRDDLSVARVVHEDDNFITLEVGKHEGVSWHVAPLSDDDPAQRFYTLLFVRKSGDGMETWKPWEEASS